MKKMIFFFLFLFGLDLLTKYFFYDLSLGEHFLLLTPSFNTWIAWSIAVPMWLVILLSFLIFVALVVLLVLEYKHKLEKWDRLFSLYVLWLVFFLAGALWNMYDRVLLWWVRDFVDLWFFPIFNIADVFLSLWVLFLFYDEFFCCKAKPKP